MSDIFVPLQRVLWRYCRLNYGENPWFCSIIVPQKWKILITSIDYIRRSEVIHNPKYFWSIGWKHSPNAFFVLLQSSDCSVNSFQPIEQTIGKSSQFLQTIRQLNATFNYILSVSRYEFWVICPIWIVEKIMIIWCIRHLIVNLQIINLKRK